MNKTCSSCFPIFNHVSTSPAERDGMSTLFRAGVHHLSDFKWWTPAAGFEVQTDRIEKRTILWWTFNTNCLETTHHIKSNVVKKSQHYRDFSCDIVCWYGCEQHFVLINPHLSPYQLHKNNERCQTMISICPFQIIILHLSRLISIMLVKTDWKITASSGCQLFFNR